MSASRQIDTPSISSIDYIYSFHSSHSIIAIRLSFHSIDSLQSIHCAIHELNPIVFKAFVFWWLCVSVVTEVTYHMLRLTLCTARCALSPYPLFIRQPPFCKAIVVTEATRQQAKTTHGRHSSSGSPLVYTFNRGISNSKRYSNKSPH